MITRSCGAIRRMPPHQADSSKAAFMALSSHDTVTLNRLQPGCVGKRLGSHGNRVAPADRSSGGRHGTSTFVDNEKLHSVKLLAVEEAGIWIESQEAVDKVIGRLQKKPSLAALAFFVPYGQITTIVAGFEPSGVE